MQTMLFPHDEVRDQQDKMISAVLRTIDRKGQLTVHAPTGLGKTAATLAPAIERGMRENKVVIFMTSRLTQHALALETVSRIRQKHKVQVEVVDLIGKKHLCLQPGAVRMKGKEFADYCRAMREDSLCTYYERLTKGEDESAQSRAALVQLGKTAPHSPEQVRMFCAQEEYQLCPYEITMRIARGARVIITDYSYLFNPSIREGFFGRIGKSLEDCILIIDEAHNLPDRVKDLASERITTYTVSRAIKELEETHEEEILHHLEELKSLLKQLAKGVDEERHLTRSELLQGIERIVPIDRLTERLERTAKTIREEGKASSAGALADFLEAWSSQSEGFARILKVDQQQTLSGEGASVIIEYRCLDPGMVTGPIIAGAHSAIAMSGTLTPVEMYAEILGMPDAELLTLASPFPQKNRLNIIIPKTTTKYSRRTKEMYAQIAEIASKVANATPGNCAIFFPSYALLNEVRPAVEVLAERTILAEHPRLTKEEREQLLDKFRQYQHAGAVLLGVMGGSFSEGIDLPGNELQCVVVVGLPLGKPDLETKALIEYYDEKFKKGWEYGYTYPAFNRTLQSAGRCIRTENDRGVIVFLDERYAWQNYYRCFPKEWDIKITLLYEDLIREFFEVQK